MPDIVDSLVVSLGLDPTQYNREIKKYRDDRKRLAEDDAKYNQSQETAQKRQIEGMRTLRNETAGFVLALAGASSLKAFATDIISGDAATGRFASNLGMATEKVAAWESAIRKAGGSAGGGRGILSQMSGVIQNINQTGDRQTGAVLSALGLTTLPQDPEELLFQLAGMAGKMPQQRYRSLLGQIGIDDEGVNLLSKGTEGLRIYIREQEKLSRVRKEDTDNAIAFENAMVDIESVLKSKARPAVEGLAGAIGQLAGNQEALNTVTNIGIGLIGAAGIAAGIAYWPFLLLAGAIAGVSAAFQDANTDARDWAQTAKFWEQLKNGDWKGAAGTFADSARDSVSRVNASLGLPAGENYIAMMNRGRDAMGNPIAGGGADSSARSVPGSTAANGNGQDIVAFFKSRGYTDAQARGITAGIMAESGGSHTARNPTSGAYGLGQHLSSDRLANFKRRYGIDIRQSTRQQQLDFIDWELRGGDRGGASVRRQSTASGALNSYIRDFMRPKAGYETFRDLQSGNAWLNGRPGLMAGRGGMGGGGAVTNNVTIGEIRINTSSKDAEGIARDMRGELAKRGLVTQANTGLTG